MAPGALEAEGAGGWVPDPRLPHQTSLRAELEFLHCAQPLELSRPLLHVCHLGMMSPGRVQINSTLIDLEVQLIALFTFPRGAGPGRVETGGMHLVPLWGARCGGRSGTNLSRRPGEEVAERVATQCPGRGPGRRRCLQPRRGPRWAPHSLPVASVWAGGAPQGLMRAACRR